MVFVDLNKAFHRVPREVIRWGLRKKGVIEEEVLAITEMYKNITTSVRIDGERSKEFEVKVGVHQGLVLSTLLFEIVMHEITKNGRKSGLKEFLNADDLVLLGDNWEEVEMRYARWKKAVTKKGLKVNVKKLRFFVLTRGL